MKVMITGATGFIGSHLARRFAGKGDDVALIVRPGSDMKLIADIADAVMVYGYDGSTGSVMDAYADFKPHATYHVASCFLASHRPEDIVRLVESNLLFGTQILEAMHAHGCRFLVNAGTSWQHFENQDYNPVCLYAATKQAFEDIIMYYVEAKGLRAVTLKLFDTYGEDDPRAKLMNVIRKALAGGEPLRMSPGDQILDLVHVDDAVDAFLAAGARVEGGDAPYEEFAVSSGERLSLKELMAVCQEVSGKSIDVVFGARPYREREVMTLWDRGRTLPGWSPKIPLREGIRRILGQEVLK